MIGAHVRGRIVGGLLILLPLAVTVYLLRVVFDLINRNVTPWVLAVLKAGRVPDLDRWPASVTVPLVSVVLSVTFIYLVGLLAGNLVGRRVLALVESWILRVPVVKGIYGSARQLLDAFSLTSK